MTAAAPAPARVPATRARAKRPDRLRTPGAFGATYRLILRNQATVGRVVAVTALGAVGVLLGLAVGLRDQVDPVETGARFIDDYGLTVLVPVVALVFASSALGDLIDDRTLVYLWLKPVNRLSLAAAAALASFTICLPAVTVPLVIAAALSGGGAALVGGTAVAAAAGVVGYVGVFTALGLRFKRALIWGLAFILLWEWYVSKASKTASRLSIRAYTRSIIAAYTGVDLGQADVRVVVAVVVPIMVGLVFVVLTGRRLARTPVD